MAYVIAEPSIGVKDASCVDACPVDCIHPKKNTTYDDGRPGFEEVPQLYIDPVEYGFLYGGNGSGIVFSIENGQLSYRTARTVNVQHLLSGR